VAARICLPLIAVHAPWLLVHAWSGSPASNGDVTAPSRMEQFVETAGGASQLVQTSGGSAPMVASARPESRRPRPALELITAA
jgi:hypothetical protein